MSDVSTLISHLWCFDAWCYVNSTACALTSKQDYETEVRDIMRDLYRLPAHGSIKLLYITPEKVRIPAKRARGDVICA